MALYITLVNEGLKTVIVISGRILLLNFCPMPLDFILVRGNLPCTATIPSKRHRGLPFDCSENEISIKTETAISYKFRPIEMIQKGIKSHDLQLKCGNRKYNYMRLTISKQKSISIIKILPSFRIKNLSPIPLSYKIANSHREFKEGDLLKNC